jgi:hypothetical protein
MTHLTLALTAVNTVLINALAVKLARLITIATATIAAVTFVLPHPAATLF